MNRMNPLTNYLALWWTSLKCPLYGDGDKVCKWMESRQMSTNMTPLATTWLNQILFFLAPFTPCYDYVDSTYVCIHTLVLLIGQFQSDSIYKQFRG